MAPESDIRVTNNMTMIIRYIRVPSTVESWVIAAIEQVPSIPQKSWNGFFSVMNRPTVYSSIADTIRIIVISFTTS